ncbi:MAG: KilA-N domain-containing protein [Eubacterium sp.]|nr:KilA-N domain-containing protein [Eubacterium sp.]
MPRAAKTELHWAYVITREEVMRRVNERVELPAEEWESLRDHLFDLIVSGEASIHESKMSASLERTVIKYLYPIDDFISLTDIARRFDSDNPSYLIQSWLRSRNTVEFLGEWERNNNSDFDETAFKKLLIDVRSPSYTLTPSKWIKEVNAIGLTSKRGKNGKTMAHPFIACDFEMWNDMKFRYEMVKHSIDFIQKE